jgi:endonuclease YncB( thermonuclease family)
VSFRSYPAKVTAVHDADTVRVQVDQGWGNWRDCSIRLSGINAIELKRPGGIEARDHLARMMPPGTPVTLISHGWDKYGDRTDGQIILPNGVDAGLQMITDGYAVAWNGKGPKPVPIWPIPTDG